MLINVTIKVTIVQLVMIIILSVRLICYDNYILSVRLYYVTIIMNR